MKKLIITLISLVLITGCSSSKSEEETTIKYQKVSGSDAANLIDDGAVLIDVRTIEEYNENHISKSVNIPLSNIIEGIEDYSKDTKIIVYCRSGARSKSAAETLVDLGYTNVYDLGSIDNYIW